MLSLVVLFILLAGLLFWLADRRQKTAGLPSGRIIYTDTRHWGPVAEPLYAASVGLTGKPDYLVERGELIIPVEVKSRRAGQAPYDSHIFQLAAYCFLVEQVYGKRPPFGILHYSNRTYSIDYTQDLERALLELLTEMRTLDRRKEVERSHSIPARCERCGFYSICEDRLK